MDCDRKVREGTWEVVNCGKFKISYCMYINILYCTVLTVLVGFTDYTTQLFTLFYCRLHESVLQSFSTVDFDPLMSSLHEGWPLILYVFPLWRPANNYLTSRRNLQLSALLSLKYLRSDGCVACVPTIHPLLRCVGNVGIRNQLLHSSVSNRLPSRCLGMDVH
jgi:hypothetical protein